MRPLLLIATLALSACGVDVATSAATAAKLKADEAKHAQELQTKLTTDINAAMGAEQQRLKAAEQESK